MDISTPQLMRELRDDHANMSVILDLLESCIEGTTTGIDPDFELMDDVMHYMTVYPDAVHHPKEDIVYAELGAKRPELASGLEDVPEDHRQIAELGTQLRTNIAAVVAGAAMPRDKFVADAKAYVTRLRNHMQWEDEHLFPRIDEMIADNSSKLTLEQVFIRDPVFELEIASGFARLKTAVESSLR